MYASGSQIVMGIRIAWGYLLKRRLVGPTLRFPGSIGVEWGPQICSSNKFPGDSDAGPELTF